MGSIIVPEHGLRDIKLTSIPGVPPNLKHPPEGCRFAARCSYVKPECKGHFIEMRAAKENRAYRCVYPEDELRKAYEMTEEMKSCLKGVNLTKVFGLGRRKNVAVDHVNFEFKKGEIVSIVGESGSGKTTLAKMLLGLINPTEGEIYFEGTRRDISSSRKKKEYWKTFKPSSRIPIPPIIFLPKLIRCCWIASKCAMAENTRPNRNMI